MTMSYEAAVSAAEENGGRPFVTVERSGAHAVVTLDDPEKLNPLSAALTVHLHRELGALARDRAVRAIVLTGRNPAFSASWLRWADPRVSRCTASSPGAPSTQGC